MGLRRIRFHHSRKTMNTYVLDTTSLEGRTPPKLFVPTTGNNRLYLPVQDYSSVDPERKVIYKNALNEDGRVIGWNTYPQIVVRTQDDLTLAKKLIEFVLDDSGANA